MGDLGFPDLNAALNATSAILIIIGWLAIRRRRIGLHKKCMLAALATSAAFLACYLYFHLVIQKGEATKFTERNPTAPVWVGEVYLGILLSHTLLAIPVLPMAITSAIFGLKNRLDRHVRLARWTMPIWLYVSVTGVVVYWMLYRLW